jgi:SAM-dependent methyltransferase
MRCRLRRECKAMLTTNQKIQYFWDSFRSTITGRGLECPSCANPGSDVVDRKYLVTCLLRCRNCKLLYRAPTTTDEQFRNYYQEEYSEGFTTDLPSAEQLEDMKKRKFAGTEKDYSKYIEVLRALGLGDGNVLLDFGSSWGYGSWQFSRAGFVVKSYELSIKRREFSSRHLGVNVCSATAELSGPFDIFFSAHVLEHVPKISGILALAKRVIRPGGWFVAFTPNGSSVYRNADPRGWHRAWGFVHPLVLDEVFYQSFFREEEYLIDSSRYKIGEISSWASEQNESRVLRLDGGELLIAVRF